MEIFATDREKQRKTIIWFKNFKFGKKIIMQYNNIYDNIYSINCPDGDRPQGGFEISCN